MRRIGVLMPISEDDPEATLRIAAFTQGLQELGWTDGRNVRIDYRWAGGDQEKLREYAIELIALAPDVIFAIGNSSVAPLQRASRTVPIVFAVVPDPVGAGFINSLARPGTNATGLLMFEYGLSAKWLELLKLIVPSVSRVAVMRDPAIVAGIGQYGAIQSVAPSFAVELTPVNVQDTGDIERAVCEFRSAPNGGLIVTASAAAVVHRTLIIALAARHKLPAVYYESTFAKDGGLLSYGPNFLDQWR